MQLQYSVHEGRFINLIILFSPECTKNLHLSQANVLFAFITKLTHIKHKVATIRGCV